MIRHQSPYPAALVAALALAGLSLGVTGCSEGEEGRDGSANERPATVEREAESGDPKAERGASPPVRIEVASGLRLDPSAQAELAEAARRFATTLAGWLYGDRRRVDVEPIAPELRRELARASPYVPPDQVGSGDGQSGGVLVSVQTSRSGVLVVTIRDSRTSYPMTASFERRAGHWQVVHLNTH